MLDTTFFTDEIVLSLFRICYGSWIDGQWSLVIENIGSADDLKRKME
jgi:hypothetical protein